MDAVYDNSGNTLKSILDSKQPIGSYSLSSHNHDSVYAMINHSHDNIYSKISHNHDSNYAKVNHSHMYLPSDANIINKTYSDSPILEFYQTADTISGMAGWKNVIKMLHNNKAGYFSEFMISFGGEAKPYYRYLNGGNDSGFIEIITANSIRHQTVNRANSAANADTLQGYTPSNFMSDKPASIEFNTNGALKGYGGVLDFHYNGSTKDYTSRILETADGTLWINGMVVYLYKKTCATVIDSGTPPTDVLWAW